MADISVAPKSQKQHTWIWALLAIAAIIGLMLWLAGQSREIETAAALRADSLAAAGERPDAVAGGEAIDLPTVAGAPDTYLGRPVSISGVSVAASLGPRAFWADVPGANPFLVVIAPEVANPETAAVGQSVNLTGTVNPVTEAEVDQWVQAGSVNAAARDEATFATHYLLVSQLGQ